MTNDEGCGEGRASPISPMAPPLRMEHSQRDASALLGEAGVLAVLGAGPGLPSPVESDDGRDPRGFDLGLVPLHDRAQPWRQVLRVAGQVSASVVDGLPVATDGDYLFTSLAITENATLAEASRATYERLLRLVQGLGFPHLLRIWNYLPEINQGAGDTERYRQFCLGRHEAFQRVGRAPDYPAASALGLHGAAGRVAVLASRHAAVAIENPAQVSAFRYPRQYGPASPSFSRASLLRTQAGDLLFVSGTAAITGHVSMHVGDVQAQLRASLANIEIVVAAALGVEQLFHATRGEAGGPNAQRSIAPDAQLRIYLRSPSDLPAVRAAFADCVHLPCSVEWLQADVCRRELLVEVEAALSWPRKVMPAARHE